MISYHTMTDLKLHVKGPRRLPPMLTSTKYLVMLKEGRYVGIYIMRIGDSNYLPVYICNFKGDKLFSHSSLLKHHCDISPSEHCGPGMCVSGVLCASSNCQTFKGETTIHSDLSIITTYDNGNILIFSLPVGCWYLA